ncbi:MAG: hypothetical protein KF760_02210 [Candidatus Eremiobacteraeota bacterium]|nr:hypothetical protein [Candidatus Eremiobacteraeota bacterium]MCW5871177.1 hypothetical protein [Candidatus Eremiobacteraeota bacterium]
MSLDAQAMLEVNRQLIFAAAKQQRQSGVESPLVVSVATFGRGVKQEMLQALEPYRTAFGHNQSLVAAPPLELARQWLKQTPPGVEEGFAVLGYAFGKTVVQQWRWDEEVGDAFF